MSRPAEKVHFNELERQTGIAAAGLGGTSGGPAPPRPPRGAPRAHTSELRRAWRDKTDDEVLVARFQAGDTAAFGILAKKYQDRLMRVVSRLVHNRADAEDVVQEAFIRAYRALPQFRGESGFYTWLFAIGMNAARNFRVMAGRREDIWLQPDADSDDPSYEGVVAADMNSPLAELESRQIIAALNAGLDAMPEHLSIPLILCQIEGMSYEDIGAAMSCPTGTVRSRIFRARELIAARLAPLLERDAMPRKRKP